MTIPTIKLHILLFFSVCLARCVYKILMLIFEVDSLLLAKQLARHLPWACRSESLIALHQQCVHVCDSLSALHISWDIRHIYREFNQTADTLSNQAIMSVIRMFFSILVVFLLCIMFTCSFPQLHPFSQFFSLLLNVSSCTRVSYISYFSFRLSIYIYIYICIVQSVKNVPYETCLSKYRTIDSTL